jgi:hypothetical protein
MLLNRVWIVHSLVAAVLMAVSGAAGIFLPSTYARSIRSSPDCGAGRQPAIFECYLSK